MIIAIDLGTTNSLVGFFEDQTHRLIPNALGELLTPSCVSIDEDGSVLVGRSAQERLLTHPLRSAAAFKRYMGSDKKIRLADREFRAEDLSALVLKSLKADAQALLKREVTDAVVTVPAYFSDTQRKATRAAAHMAGLNVLRLLSEPTAAALAYDLHANDAEQNFIVIDLGGGTFDVSVLEVFEGVVEVRASAGDNFLGGEDFVLALTAHVKKALSMTASADERLNANIKSACQNAIHALRHSGVIDIRFIHQDKPYDFQMSADEFDALTAPLLARLRTPIEAAIRDSRIKLSDIHNIVFAGGATRLPSVRRTVSKLFGRIPLSTLNPDEVVARGAAVQAGLLAKNSALAEKFLTDVCPYTLGIETTRRLPNNEYESGHYLPIINRNTPIPTARTEVVSPVEAHQKLVSINVFQGESRLVKDNIALGSFKLELEGVTEGKAHLKTMQTTSIDIVFTYDVDGLLVVEAVDLSTGKQKRVVLAGNQHALSEDEINTRMQSLASLRIHPRDRSEARALTAKGDRLYEQTLGDDREQIAHALTNYQIALNSLDDKNIANATKMLANVLNDIESRSQVF